jgi:small subunit ribosomal protein S17
MITKKGIVTSAKMTGTVTVTVHRHVFHPLYKKSYRMSKKFLADSRGQDIGVGDEVLIVECRPLSKHKRFKVAEVLKRAPRVSDIQDEQAALKAIHREKVAADKKEEETASTPAA